MATQRWFGWFLDLVVGGVAGLWVGAVAAINLGLFLFGIDYEESMSDVFGRDSIGGWIVTAVLLAGPVVGVWAMRMLRRAHRESPLRGSRFEEPSKRAAP